MSFDSKWREQPAKMKVLPEHILRLVDQRDRAKLGRAGMSAAEANTKCTVDNERKLQNLIDSYLRQRSIEPIRSRSDKRTTINVGTPDFMFAYQGRPIASKS